MTITIDHYGVHQECGCIATGRKVHGARVSIHSCDAVKAYYPIRTDEQLAAVREHKRPGVEWEPTTDEERAIEIQHSHSSVPGFHLELRDDKPWMIADARAGALGLQDHKESS